VTSLVIIIDGPEPKQCVRRNGRLRWVDVVKAGATAYGPPKVVPCACGTMKPAGSRYHAAMLRERDELKCVHGNVHWSDCQGRIPPPCCWEGER
jgi:hypothetical protein